jgi:fermentation-respiration switch protein FrsA (DUF1100 family)
VNDQVKEKINFQSSSSCFDTQSLIEAENVKYLARLKRMLLTATVIASMAYCAVLILLYTQQRTLMFPLDASPVMAKDFGLADAQDLMLPTPDGQNIAAWYRPADAGKPTLIYCHGNGGNRSYRTQLFAYYAQLGWGVMFFDYRGYGGSTGAPTEAALRMDAETAYDWLRSQNVSAKQIVLSGHSLGTGICTMLASTRSVMALSLQAPYSSIADVAASVYWWAPVHLLIRDPIDAATAIRNVHVPVYVQHGDADETVPFRFGEKLFAAANEPKYFVRLSSSGHTFDEASWVREHSFFEETLKKATP